MGETIFYIFTFYRQNHKILHEMVIKISIATIDILLMQRFFS